MSESNKEYKEIIIELEKRIKKLEEKERFLNDRLNALQHVVSDIEEDIYENDYDNNDDCDCGCDDDCDCGCASEEDCDCNDDFEFEIVCPYCDAEFAIKFESINEDFNQIKCPECNNIIELDWTEEDEEDGMCQGHCSGCHGCSEEIEENNNEQEQEDDM